MSWTITVEKRIDDDGECYARLLFVNGVIRFRRDWHSIEPSMTNIADYAAKVVTTFEKQQALWATIPDGALLPVAIPSRVLTPVEIAQIEYDVALAELQKIKELVALNVILSTDKPVSDAENAAKAAKTALDNALKNQVKA